MARTYPLSLEFKQCLESKEDSYSFSSLFLEDLHSGHQEYLANNQQLIDALPKSLDPTSHFALRAQVTPAGHQRLRHSMRAALWWLLPSDGNFRRSSNGIQYYLARQGRSVVLRGGNVTQPFHESHLCWIPDPTPSPPRRAEQEFPVTLCALIKIMCLCVNRVIPRRPPLLRAAHQELLLPHLSLRNAGEGEGGRLAEQSIKIERPVQLPQ